MSQKARTEYDKAKEMLAEYGILCPTSTESYLYRISEYFVASKMVEGDDLHKLSAANLLRAADVCITRNIDLPLAETRFSPGITIEAKDVEIVLLTSYCSCFVKPECSVAKDNLAYVTSFTGETIRLHNIVKSWRASDFHEYFKEHRALANLMIDEFGPFPPNFAGILRMKAHIWFETASIIASSKRMSSLKLKIE